jgi:hypothetical protein
MDTISLDQIKTKYYGEIGEPERDRLEHELALMRCTTLDELLDVEYGKVGTQTRNDFDRETKIFCQEQNQKEKEGY